MGDTWDPRAELAGREGLAFRHPTAGRCWRAEWVYEKIKIPRGSFMLSPPFHWATPTRQPTKIITIFDFLFVFWLQKSMALSTNPLKPLQNGTCDPYTIYSIP